MRTIEYTVAMMVALGGLVGTAEADLFGLNARSEAQGRAQSSQAPEGHGETIVVTAPRAAPADSVENLALAWFSRYVEAPLTTYRRNPSRRNAIALGRAFRHGADEDSTGHTLLGFSVQQETRRQLPPVSARYAQYDGSFYDIPWEDEHREEPPVPAQARRTSLLIADVVRAEFTLRYWENAVTGANHAVPPPRRTEGQVRTILRRVLGI